MDKIKTKMDIDLDNKRKRQEDGHKNQNPFAISDKTHAIADSSSAASTSIHPILKQPVIQPTDVTSNQNTVLTSQIEEVVELCKTFSKNMEILNNNQTEIKMRIHSQEEKAENNMRNLEIGIKNTLDQNNEAVEAINALNQQTQHTQSQMVELHQELQQVQHRQQSPERSFIRSNTLKSTFQPHLDNDSSNHENSNKQLTEALRLLGSGTYNGDSNEWFEYKLRVENIIEALDLTKD